MTLATLWFIILAILWVGFFVLEGFDFGVGGLHRVVGRTDTEQRVAINSIGPVWDGNEVWLIVGGAGIFAAFPAWYATWFSAGYLALVLVLVALIIRGVSFEWRGKGPDQRWRNTFSWMLTVGSLLAPLLIGVALGDLLAGLPVNSDEIYTGNFFNLLTPYGLVTGVTVLVLCLAQGMTFLTLKTAGAVHDRARVLARTMVVPAAVLTVIQVVWSVLLSSGNPLAYVFAVVTLVGAVLSVPLVRGESQGRGFAATSVAIGGVAATLFASLYPNVLISSTSAQYNLTVTNAASGSYALTVMTIVAVVLFPVVLVYQGWTYHVFRARLRTPDESEKQLTA
jgi:cytochrome bd ubiquinol oxidase subunit II